MYSIIVKLSDGTKKKINTLSSMTKKEIEAQMKLVSEVANLDILEENEYDNN